MRHLGVNTLAHTSFYIFYFSLLFHPQFIREKEKVKEIEDENKEKENKRCVRNGRVSAIHMNGQHNAVLTAISSFSYFSSFTASIYWAEKVKRMKRERERKTSHFLFLGARAQQEHHYMGGHQEKEQKI